MAALIWTAGIAVLLVSASSQQVEPAAAGTPARADAAAGAVRIAASTIVDIEITEALSSKTAVPGQRFAIRLVQPIAAGGGGTLLPAGARGEGEIIHARKAGFAGKAGELILAARFLRCGTVDVPLGRFKFAAAGDDRSKSAAAVNSAAAGASVFTPIAGVGTVVAFLIKGGQMEVPAGARATAQVKADVELSEDAVAACGEAVMKEGES
ncbi:hypothetical protein [Sphingomonas sp.]|uniref:hypothetical protein n=1 Tax=Sphingomonas sp. TaxID=28214 RepID=UPI0031E3EE48